MLLESSNMNSFNSYNYKFLIFLGHSKVPFPAELCKIQMQAVKRDSTSKFQMNKYMKHTFDFLQKIADFL